ncbi:MAG TPA: amidohydrolase family protein [Acidimicrobiales bacterium]|jgi:N-acyl-D-aspartate/D-glutamate deacylase|nr:amidohydrolase family protein [Acidimicrobiales bacterium]
MDQVLRNAKVIDGTGAPARAADIGIEDGRIAAVGDVAANGAHEVDLDGLVLAPGFVDIHTHYDAQVLWDRDLTPSCWHGVTTVVMGNCGFGIAPTRPEHRSTIARTLENVEGMSVEALEAGIPWTFESFPEYLNALDGAPTRLNTAAMIGHTPLRLYVLGDEASERPAKDDEVDRMRELVAEALAAGALGFATSKSPTHAGAEGKPVPSRLAELDEVARIADAIKQNGRGIMQITPGAGLFINEMADLSERTGQPVSWTALLTGIGGPGTALQLLDLTAKAGKNVWPQIACRPLVMQISFEDPFAFASADAFKEVLAVPREQRADIYADPAWRERARTAADSGGVFDTKWDKTTIAETKRHSRLMGRSLADIAAERGVEPMDAAIDLALDEDLKTRFRVVLANDDEDEVGKLLQDERAVLGLSDAGAHASQLCDACFSTHLLSHWTREKGILTLEQAVWRLTGQPTQIFGITDRGRIEEGLAADLVAFDPDTVGVDGELERVWDLPAGADRLIARSKGVEHVWVNGTAIRDGGQDVTNARPGKLLRGGRAS